MRWVFFTGGVESTFRLMELLLDGHQVQPIYIRPTDPRRAQVEDDRMNAVINLTRKKYGKRVMYPIYIHVEQLQVGEDIRRVLRFLQIPFGWDAQLNMTLISFSLNVGPSCGAVDHCGIFDAERQWTLLARIRPFLDAYGCPRFQDYPDLHAMRFLRFPLAVHTQFTITVQAQLEGWEPLLRLSDEEIAEAINVQPWWGCLLPLMSN